MFYCYPINPQLFLSEIAYAKDLGVYVGYDEKTKKFYDKDGNETNIKDKVILVRDGAYQTKDTIQAVIDAGGKPLNSLEEFDKVLSWPNYVQTKRTVELLKGSQILDCPQYIINRFGSDKIFFKTKVKNYSQVIEVDELCNPDSAIKKAIKQHKDDEFILSDVLDIEYDSNGMVEYRGFIINNNLTSISRINDYLMGTIPHSVVQKMSSIVESLKDTDFPNSYVLDICVCKGKNGCFLDVLECNPIECSGTYLYNSVLPHQVDLFHNCPKGSIPIEKIKYGPKEAYSYATEACTTPSIIYEFPGGFAADVLCIKLLGTPSTPGSFIHIDKASNFTIGLVGTPNGRKNKLLNMDPKLITSDLIKAIEDEGLPDPDEVIKQMEALEQERSLKFSKKYKDADDNN